MAKNLKGEVDLKKMVIMKFGQKPQIATVFLSAYGFRQLEPKRVSK